MIGYRKYSIAAAYIAVAIIMRVTGYIPAEGWLSDLTTGVVAFFAGNLTEHITTVIKEKING